MNKLDPPQSPRWLLSFDFDGTLHHPADDPPVRAEFFDLIRRLRRDHAALWVINTGRSLGHFVEGLISSAVPFLPDFAVVRESEIFEANQFGRWVALEPWNSDCEKVQRRFLRQAKRSLNDLRKRIERETGAEWMRHPGEPAAIIARSEEEMDWICSQLGDIRDALPDLGWQRNSIYLRFGHRNYHKGSTLAEIGRLTDIPPERRFAIGDGQNDLGMLDPTVAARIACPANSVDEVREHVVARGGFPASQPHSAGVIEALESVFKP